MYFNRAIEPILLEALKQFPVCILTGARQVGKSTLLKNHLKNYTYVTLDEPLVREVANNDPKLFLSRYKSPLIIDEIQYAPGLLPYIKIIVDENRQTYGQYVLTGSQSFSFMQGVLETLAGRAAIFELYPPSFNEIISLPNALNIYDVNHVVKQIIKGFYPELITVPTIDHKTWYASYLATYIERDIRQLIKIVDLNKFQTFISLLATRAGQLFNISEISKECGVSSPTIKSWLSALEASYIIFLIKPYSKNISKRLVKSPKLYFIDSGLLCYLLGIDSEDRFFKASEKGHIFENMIVVDYIKQLKQQQSRFEVYFYRDSGGLEVDLLIEKQGLLNGFEIKFSSTVNQKMVDGLVKIKKELSLNYSAVLSLEPRTIPLREGIDTIHWSKALDLAFIKN